MILKEAGLNPHELVKGKSSARFFLCLFSEKCRFSNMKDSDGWGRRIRFEYNKFIFGGRYC
jgi:hypothetical protein